MTEPTTAGAALHATMSGPHAYRRLSVGAGEPHQHRTDLAAAPVRLGDPVLTVAHLSDIHICDHQSPARIEFLDRWADPDSPVRDLIDEIGTYRAQEVLTAQVAEAMVRGVNAVPAGPVAGRPIDLALVTGDNTDNAQANELQWYLDLLDGGEVRPDSGDLDRYEGVADAVIADERFWHPELVGSDLPQQRYGLPHVPGLLDAMRRPFRAAGLTVPWLAVHGNHDRMVQGTVPAGDFLAHVAVGSAKAIGLPADWSTDRIVALVDGLARCDPSALEALGSVVTREVTADAGRRIITREEFVAAHRRAGARPAGHGIGAGTLPYYRFDTPAVTFLVLDTVDEHGGWQGSLDAQQFAWLAVELAAADRDRRLVVLASHHPLHTLVNDTTVPGAGRRVLAAEVAELLAAHRSVVLWLNGHTHATAARAHGSWWELTAPSLIDWPQQSRIVEVLRGEGTLTVAATMLDHAGPTPWPGTIGDVVELAGLSRELAANDWQWHHHDHHEHPRAGTPRDRNVLLHLADPFVGGSG